MFGQSTITALARQRLRAFFTLRNKDRAMKTIPTPPTCGAFAAADLAAGCSGGRRDYRLIADAPDVWAQISEEAYWEALEILPPIYFPRGFAVSEPSCHNAEGRPVYLLVRTISGQHFARYGTLPGGAR